MDNLALFLDPYLFMTPSDPDKPAWIKFIDRLLAWSQAFKRHDVCTSDQALAALRLEKRYPDIDTLRRVFTMLEIDSYSPVDVSNALRTLSDREPFAEARIGIFDAAAAGSLDPALDGRLPSSVGKILLQTLAGVALACKRLAQHVPAIGTIEARISDPSGTCSVMATDLRLTATITLIEDCHGGVCEVDASEAFVDVLFDLVQSCRAGATTLDEVCRDPAEATRLLVAEIAANEPTSPPRARPVRGGTKFLDSLDQHGIVQQRALLVRLYRLAALAAIGRLHSLAGAKVHPVRTGLAADAPQVTRGDGDKLWRCMLTKSGAGYRLHYWECVDGAIELDEVMVESEV